MDEDRIDVRIKLTVCCFLDHTLERWKIIEKWLYLVCNGVWSEPQLVNFCGDREYDSDVWDWACNWFNCKFEIYNFPLASPRSNLWQKLSPRSPTSPRSPMLSKKLDSIDNGFRSRKSSFTEIARKLSRNSDGDSPRSKISKMISNSTHIIIFDDGKNNKLYELLKKHKLKIVVISI